MKVTYIERSPGVFRLRIETGRSAPSIEHPAGERLFAYETVRGVEDDARRRRFDIIRSHDEGSFARPDKLTVSGFLGRPVTDTTAFSYWVAQRLALGKIGRSTAENYQTMLDTHVIPKLGATRLQKLTAQDIQGVYAAGIAAGHAPSVAHLHRILRAAFKAARKVRLIILNVMDEVDSPRGAKLSPKAIDAASMEKVVAACEGNWKWPIAIVAFGAGLRRGEVLGLRRQDVDLARAKINVCGQLVGYRDGTLEWKTPKTDAGTRTISISPELVDVLREAMRAGLEARMRAGLGGAGLDNAPVFTFDGSAWIRPARLTESFGNLCDDIGLPAFTFHGARHTHATLLLKRVGKSGAKAVSKRMGHADVGVTLRVYQTVFEEDDRELADLQGPISRRIAK